MTELARPVRRLDPAARAGRRLLITHCLSGVAVVGDWFAVSPLLGALVALGILPGVVLAGEAVRESWRDWRLRRARAAVVPRW